MSVYYNENDPKAAEWTRELINAGELPDGTVDERDIRDVRPVELRGFSQHHFFAGIGVWARAAWEAGWPESWPLWTGSCPCQPFSAAGKGEGFDDERHLWPSWFWLIREFGADIVLGEQVASKDGLAWLDLVSTDMEGEGYAVGASDTCSAGFGAPHIRQRSFFAGVADREQQGLEGLAGNGDGEAGRSLTAGPATLGSCADRMGHANKDGFQPGRLSVQPGRQNETAPITSGSGEISNSRSGPVNGFWRDADWLGCRDGKWRPVEPGLKPLAHGVAGRVGLLRGYGNAINLQQAKAFIEAVIDYLHTKS